MMSLRFSVGAAIVLAAFSAIAQNAPPSTVRATIETIAPDGASLTVRTREGGQALVRVPPATAVTLVVPAALADVKPGAFIGVAAMPDEGGELKAMEVHIFPEAMRGTGEGFRPFDLAPGSTMTNGNIAARVEGVDGPKLTVTYKGGQQTIAVDAKAPIVGFTPGAPSDLKPGAAIIARDEKKADASINAARILVGKDGLVPPM